MVDFITVLATVLAVLTGLYYWLLNDSSPQAGLEARDLGFGV